MLAVCLTGCGSSGRPPLHSATLILDFTPNAVHAGIYSALARHYDQAAGLQLHVIAPTASTDAVKLLETGRADFAILDIHDLAIARQRGEDVVGLMAIVERPLAAVLAAPRIANPGALQGRSVGITGVPSDTAVLDSILAGAGASPRRVRTVTIGFNAVPDLLAGKVAAATGFWNDEGITLSRARPGFHSFRVDAYGAPPYPELILCTTEARLRADPGLAKALVRTLIRGYGVTVADPRASAQDLESQVAGLDPRLVSAELNALRPALRSPDGRIGGLDAATLNRWAAWEVRFGIVRRRPDVAATFDLALNRGAAR